MAAENASSAEAQAQDRSASMRPRRMAAENDGVQRPARPPPRGFNEAAAHGRGKHTQQHSAVVAPGSASMRPRRMAAEN